MQNALRVQTTILAGGRIEITDSQLSPGDTVEVIVLLPRDGAGQVSALDILASSPGKRLFKTVEEVDDYVRTERDAWED